jgi:hypothetical protein
MCAAFCVKTAMLLGQTLLYNILGAGDVWFGTEDGDCQSAFALWQGAAVSVRTDVPAGSGAGKSQNWR